MIFRQEKQKRKERIQIIMTTVAAGRSKTYDLVYTKKYFPNVIIWLDTIILRISTESKSVKCISGYYEILKDVRELLNETIPYTRILAASLSDIPMKTAPYV